MNRYPRVVLASASYLFLFFSHVSHGHVDQIIHGISDALAARCKQAGALDHVTSSLCTTSPRTLHAAGEV